METREIKITRETAERWYNGCDKELKELALQTYPELKEPEYKIGEVYAFASSEKEFENGYFYVDTLKKITTGECPYKRTNGGYWKFIRKIEYKFVD
jgi:hypothetical protein